MALTSAEYNRIRRLVGDHGTPAIFSDETLEQYYSDVGESFEKTIVECFDVLLSDAAKRAYYRQANSSESDSKVFDQLSKLRDQWAARAGVGKGQIRTGDLTFGFYDNDGTAIPDDTADSDYGWILN